MDESEGKDLFHGSLVLKGLGGKSPLGQGLVLGAQGRKFLSLRSSERKLPRLGGRLRRM